MLTLDKQQAQRVVDALANADAALENAVRILAVQADLMPLIPPDMYSEACMAGLAETVRLVGQEVQRVRERWLDAAALGLGASLRETL